MAAPDSAGGGIPTSRSSQGESVTAFRPASACNDDGVPGNDDCLLQALLGLTEDLAGMHP